MPWQPYKNKTEQQPSNQASERISNEVDLSQLESVVPLQLAGHIWMQQGDLLICTSCPYEHATGVPRRILTSQDEHGITLEKR
jgi:hypothetical protein